MSGWLFDTNVLSAFAPGRATPAAYVIEWVETNSEALFISAFTVMEVEAGIAKLRRSGALRRADALAAWLDGMLGLYEERVLQFDVEAARIAGLLHDAAISVGRHPGLADIAIAAIARSRGLVLLTLNRRHFIPLGIETLNPFDA